MSDFVFVASRKKEAKKERTRKEKERRKEKRERKKERRKGSVTHSLVRLFLQACMEVVA